MTSAAVGQTRSFVALESDRSLFDALRAAAATHGGSTPCLADAETPAIPYSKAIIGSRILGRKVAAGTAPGEAVAVLLPNVVGLVLTIFGLNAEGRVAALLNFTAGARNLLSAVDTAKARVIVTSRRFIAMAELDDVVTALEQSKTPDGAPRKIVYLEDVRTSIGALDKARGVASGILDRVRRLSPAANRDKPAVILFTSGTEGHPKGVVLTNGNLLSNARQIFDHADGELTPSDHFFNPLPIFHSFGLTAGTLTPILNGMQATLYPTPLHYKQIPKLIEERRPTVLLATDTFLQGYGRSADNGDLDSLRFAIAGAEKVKEPTRALFKKSGVLLLEGYGATECAPVLACNLPKAHAPGSVGRLLPGLEFRITPVEGITDGGRLYIRGPNVMAGYLKADRPGELQPPADGWHDTGDIIDLDDEGFVRIKGRAKRFAKIAGEMVSLAVVETLAADVWPEETHVALTEADPKRGEQLILMTERASPERSALVKAAQKAGLPELWVPKRIMTVPEIPRLGSGKVDFPAAARMMVSG
ncbi:MAG: AMP-binding protein [Pseudomonadota bacterium]